MQNLKKKTEGFTIIEVMIVLVIAAVIILIVFLAVPALQRNSRNTQLRNDVGKVLAGVTEFQNNNNGQQPTSVTTNANNGEVTITKSGSGIAPVVVKVQQGNTFTNGTTISNNPNTVTIYFDRKCDGNGFAGSETKRAVAAGYRVEGANNQNPEQCTDS